MVKRVKGNAESSWSQSVQESAHLIWLAGLGAFAKMGSEGGKLFETLVKEGEKIEEQTRNAAAGVVETAKARAGESRGKVADTWDKVEQIFEDRLARVLGQLGVPSHDDVRDLTRRIDALQVRIDEVRRARS